MESYHSIRDFLNDLVLNGMEPEKDAVSGESVKLMTLHASKGLEFDYVFIIGVNDGLIPLNSVMLLQKRKRGDCFMWE